LLPIAFFPGDDRVAKPVVVSSGKSVSMRSQGPMTVTTGAQYTQLVKNGIVTQVSTGGQITTVSAGDVISHSLTGATNILAKEDASITSTAANANLVGEKSVLVHGKNDDVFIKAGQRIALVCGESAIVLLADGTIVLQGKKGLLSFTDELDERGGKIYLNCAAPVGSEAPPPEDLAQLMLQMQQLADAKAQLERCLPARNVISWPPLSGVQKKTSWICRRPSCPRIPMSRKRGRLPGGTTLAETRLRSTSMDSSQPT